MLPQNIYQLSHFNRQKTPSKHWNHSRTRNIGNHHQKILILEHTSKTPQTHTKKQRWEVITQGLFFMLQKTLSIGMTKSSIIQSSLGKKKSGTPAKYWGWSKTENKGTEGEKKRKSRNVPTLALPSQHSRQNPGTLPQVCICFSKLGRK